VSLSPGGSSFRKKSLIQAVTSTGCQNDQKAVRKVSVALRARSGPRWRAGLPMRAWLPAKGCVEEHTSALHPAALADQKHFTEFIILTLF